MATATDHVGSATYGAGVPFPLNAGEGACERVLTGYRTLPAEPAKPERQGLIYETRCIDPLAERVNA